MSFALFTTLALAVICPCELVEFDDAPELSAYQDGPQHRELFNEGGVFEGGVSERVGLSSVVQPSVEDVRSRHLSLRDLPPRESPTVTSSSASIQRDKAPVWPALEWRTKQAEKVKVEKLNAEKLKTEKLKAEKVPFSNAPAPFSLSENSWLEASNVSESTVEDYQDGWLDADTVDADTVDADTVEPDTVDPDTVEQAEGVLLVDAVPANVLGIDNLEIGVEAVIPPPVPIEAIQADLLEVLGLDSQVPEAPAPQPREVPPWAATVYGGRFTSDDLGPALIGDLSGFEDSALVGFGLARTLAGRRPLSLEAEGQILQHFGNQGHSEVTVALVLRWHDFPWDDKIDTTFAIGEGLSFATSVPELEIRRNGRSTQLLNYLLFELTFALPQEPDWQFVARLHHRSGVYGLFDGVGSGSNIYSAGIRRRF